jgi:hypothetical protein
MIGDSRFQVNDQGWQVGDVFKTIFKYLEAPISVDHTVDLETETSGVLPEARIRNDDLLARVADNEKITGFWSFEDGQIIVQKGTLLPLGVIEAGRIFQRVTDNNLFIGDGTGWIRLIKESDLQNKPDFSWGFTRPALVSAGDFLKFGDTPMSGEEGMPIAIKCRLTGVVVRVSTTVMDGSGVEILKNGSVIGSVSIVNGTKGGADETLGVEFGYNDFVSVRTKPTNTSTLDSPRVTLLFKSSLI